VLNQSSHVYGVTSQSAPAWVPVAAPLAMLTLAAVAALLPALRAGRLGAAEAIATGQAPRARYGKLAQSALGRLRRLPRPVTIGLAAPFARPLRTLVTLSAIAFGTIAVLFATGLNTSLVRVTDAQTATAIGQVNLLVPNPLDPGSAQDTTAATAIRAQPGTAHAVGESSPTVTVPGVAGQASAHALLGDASWVGMDLIAGRWFAGDGEIVVNTAFLTQSGHTIGDTVTVTTGGRQGTPRIVGEVFDPEGHQKATLYTSWNTLGGAAAGLRIDRYDIGLTPGTDRSSYATALTGAFPAPPPGGPGYFADAPTKGERGKTVAVALIGVLTLMMAFVAALGVLNTVLQSTRERVHDLGVFKAVGMTPRQTIVMVVCWVAGPAVIAAAVAVPVAVTLHRWVLDAMARTSGTGLPPDIRHVYSAGELALVALSGLVIAALGALLPASWAAGSRTATALRAE